MKRIISALLAVLLAATVAWAVIGYNRSEVSKEIIINPAYESMEDTNITLNAPSEATAGQSIEVNGRLTDSSGMGIPGKEIWVSWYGSFDMDRTVTTDSSGCFTKVKEVPTYGSDKEILKATFAGD